ncbi:MAG: tyrosine--tRNA ligase [Candidatus Buchananbacteria bacterium]|nr:tyrosine--tRNA ligase [Candidatus Buchananbacteria bacterium]
MPKTDSNHIKELLNRGVSAVYPTPEALEKFLTSGKTLKLYHGIDPTGSTLHLGHLVQLLKLKQFQDLGHQVIILIGDFTAQIGDPTDKSATRKPLTKKQVLQNCKNYKKQIGKILNLKKTKFVFNSKWLEKMNFADVLKLTSEFTVQRLLERDMFENRIKEGKPIHLHEFLYPVMQGYDSVALDVDLEIGGNDQTFNMLAGRTLMRSLKNKEKMVLTTKLLVDPSGKKMGKTEGNMITLADQANDVYGKVMSWSDELILPGFEILTKVPMSEVEVLADEIKRGENPKTAKMLLAYKVVELLFDVKAAISAEENFKQVFQEGLNPDEIPVFQTEARNIVEVLVASGMASSKTEARRLIQQGGVKVDEKIVKDENFEIEMHANGVVIQKGKRHFIKIK